MSIYTWTSEIKNIYVWTTPAKEVYVWTTKVRPSWWKPWSNTIAYYPLTSSSTINDMSGNWKNLTNSWVAFWTYQWVDCWYFNDSATASRSWSLFTGNPTFTASVWFWNISYQNNWEQIWSLGSTTGTNCFSIFTWRLKQLYVWGWNNDRNTWATIERWVWNNVIFAYSSSWWDVYLNWEKVYTWTWTPTIWNTITRISWEPWWSQLFYWYLSNIIFESVKRTESQATAYYNLTKSNYWL